MQLQYIPYDLIEKIGSGVDGDVYSILGQSNKVIKIGKIDFTNELKSVMDYILFNRVEPYAKLYHYGFANNIYYYVIEKLLPLSEDEEKVFHTIISHEDRGIEKNYSSGKLFKILTELNIGLDFDINKVMLFCELIENASIKHLDLHQRNILKDANGNYKLIDFERCKLK